jgi:hypothetical protein
VSEADTKHRDFPGKPAYCLHRYSCFIGGAGSWRNNQELR